ncbi:hypothetical protein DL93DRAFT_215934 [Clavulina sp. PMI_390]|nr:hypothetical protein DL93DRAFT_215934 [Clavulina sp. PMI_390]
MTLSRGEACLQCRQHKIRCNGARPVCSRCHRSQKECAYAPPTTEAMEVLALGSELRLLKSALASTHGLSLASARLLQRIQRMGTTNVHTLVDTTWLPIYPPSRHDRNGSGPPKQSGRVLRHGSVEGYTPIIQRAAIEHELSSYEWSGFEELPSSLSHHLIGLFLPYRSHYFFFTDIPDFLCRLSHPPSHPESIHPCLLNACYLGACVGTGDTLASLHPFFIKRTRHFLDQALMLADRIPHFLWASVILGCFLGRARRLEEAFAVISAAARFASACGLIRGFGIEKENEEKSSRFLLPPPKDLAEAVDRLRLAHSIYLVDQGVAALTTLPTTFNHDEQLKRPLEQVDSLHDRSEKNAAMLINELSEFRSSDIYLKASAVRTFEQVNKLAISFRDYGYHGIKDEYVALSDHLSSQQKSIPPLSDPRGLRPSEEVSSFNPHILLAHFTLHGAGLILWSLRASDDSDATRKMLGCLHHLLRICEMTRGSRHLRRVQTTIFALLHIRNAVRAIARELLKAEVRQNTILVTNYCSVIESLLDFLDDMTMVYKEWSDVPSSLKHTLARSANFVKVIIAITVPNCFCSALDSRPRSPVMPFMLALDRSSAPMDMGLLAIATP